MQLLSEKLEMIQSCGIPYLENATRESIEQIKALYQDITSNRNLWMDKLFRLKLPYYVADSGLPLSTHGILRCGGLRIQVQTPNWTYTPPSWKASFILSKLGEYYLQTDRPRKALRVLNLVLLISEHITMKIIDAATPPFQLVHKMCTEKETWICSHLALLAAVESDAKEEAHWFFHKCTQLEIPNAETAAFSPYFLEHCMYIGSREFIRLVEEANQMQRFQRARQERSFTLLLEVLDEIGIDALWVCLQGICANFKSRDSLDKCSFCKSQKVIMECSCGNAACCSLEHSLMHWPTHKPSCCCAHCGDNTAELKHCTACEQAVFCCSEHSVTHWPTHKEECQSVERRSKLIDRVETQTRCFLH